MVATHVHLRCGMSYVAKVRPRVHVASTSQLTFCVFLLGLTQRVRLPGACYHCPLAYLDADYPSVDVHLPPGAGPRYARWRNDNLCLHHPFPLLPFPSTRCTISGAILLYRPLPPHPSLPLRSVESSLHRNR